MRAAASITGSFGLRPDCLALRPIGFRQRPDGQAVAVLAQPIAQPSELAPGLLGAQSAGPSQPLKLAPIQGLTSQTQFML